MRLWITVAFAVCASVTRAQSAPCAEVQLRKGVDSTSTYSISQVHLNNVGRMTNRKLNICLAPMFEKPVVLNQAFITGLCTCRAGGRRLATVRVEPVDRNDPKDQVTMMLKYEKAGK